MSNRIFLPGSRQQESAEFGATRGRFSEDEANALAEVVRWWRYRREQDGTADPLESLVGGVDLRFTVQTVGLVPATAVLPRPLLPGTVGSGVALLAQALGVPVGVTAAGEVYSLVALAHFYRVGSTSYMSRHTTIGRTPAATTSTAFETAVSGTPPDVEPVLLMVGVSGLTIDWTVEVSRLDV